jgi:anti-sigma regulatory factor (Ser/Thr protein kinase)/FixJ family two-component response regulator
MARTSYSVAIVGDDGDDLESSYRALEEAGYEVALTDDVESTLALAYSQQVSADVLVPRIPADTNSILRVLQKFQEQPSNHRAYSIIQTRETDGTIRKKLMGAGAFYCFTMPMRSQTLCRTIRAALLDATYAATIQQYVESRKGVAGRIMSGVFEFTTHSEGRNLATMLAMNFPEPERVATGIWELFCNAVEHGNLEIDFNLKGELLERGEWEKEIESRHELTRFAERVVRVDFCVNEKNVTLHVEDQGPGFDFKKFLDTDQMDFDRPNGRGILIAQQMSFDHLEYLGRGNEVKATIKF